MGKKIKNKIYIKKAIQIRNKSSQKQQKFDWIINFLKLFQKRIF